MAEPEVQLPNEPKVTTPAEPEVQTAALDPVLTPEDTAVLEALSEPALPAPLSDADIEAKYAADGIWARAPQVPPAPAGVVNLENLYLTSIDPVSTATDAVALPPVVAFETDKVLSSIASPAAAGTRFVLDDNGLVMPTVAGALSPDGFTVYLGRPPLVPPATLARATAAAEDAGIEQNVLAEFRPQPRPAGLLERAERVRLGGLSKSELAAFRPALRPQSVQERAEQAAAAALNTDDAVNEALATAADPFVTATQLAITSSYRPGVRPQGFAQIVQRALRTAPAPETRVASAAAIAPRTVTPQIPSRASVAKAATTNNAINLRQINLIGVYGKPSNRRALVRLSNGRYKKVVLGDRIDGGVVSAIGEAELRYTKRGRDLVLKMPR